MEGLLTLTVEMRDVRRVGMPHFLDAFSEFFSSSSSYSGSSLRSL